MTTETLRRGIPLGRRGRVLLGLWSLFLIAGFATAAMLSPDPRGFGTHQRLGLPSCSVLTLTGVKCPTCGMTTSFANFVRGRFAESVRANAAGFCLACACAAMIPWCMVSVRRGVLWGVWQPDRWMLCLAGGVLGLSLLQWAAWMWLE